MLLRKAVSLKIIIMAAFSLLVACSGQDNSAPSKEEIQFKSHLDQARFFQKQGQLKASIREAQNAININPSSRKPFLIIAETLLITGDAVKAKDAYEQMLKVQPETATKGELNEAHVGLAKSLLLLGKVDDAMTELDKIQEPNATMSARADIVRGDIELSKRNTDVARTLYTKALESDPKSFQALLGLSKASFLQSDKDGAAAELKKAEDLAPNDSDVWLWKAKMSALEKNFPAAEDAYVRALEDIGQYDLMTLQKYQTISELIEVLRAQGKHAEAFTYQEVLDKSGPGSIKNSYVSALEAVKNKDYAKAEEYLKGILEKAPGHREAGVLLGMVKYQQGDWEAADKYLSQFATEDVNSAVTKALAATKLKLQQPEAAARLVEKLPKEDPDSLSIYGVAELESGNLASGVEALEKALALDASNTVLVDKLGKAYLANGQADKAITLLSDSKDKSPKSEGIRALLVSAYAKAGKGDQAKSEIEDWKKAIPNSALAFNAEGAYYSSLDQFDKAEKAFDQAKKISPDLKTPYRNSILLFAKTQNWNKLLDETKGAVKQFPEDLALIRALFEAANKLNKLDEATSYLEEIANNVTTTAAPSLTLAEFYARTGEFEKARQFLSKAKGLDSAGSQLESTTLLVATLEIPSLIKAQKNEEARKLATEVAKTLPDRIEARLLPVKTEFLTDNEAAGVKLLNEIKKEFSDSSLPYEVEGDHYYSKGEFEKAINAFQLAWYQKQSQSLAIKMHETLKKAQAGAKSLKPLEEWVSIEPNSPQTITLLAMGYQANNMPDKAIEQYEKLRQIRPNDAVALNNLSWLYFEKGDARALELAENAYKLQPESAAIADTYGWIMYKNGDAKNALPILKKATTLDSKSEEIKAHYDEAAKAAGQ
ncbi:tetratricopeptide repeat protein [Hahella sp. NBU794]|uniref:tetratricopeptide repeat protein n=1 Tax=Hahella sp. NBU794 TaxID=3422590 RepID=UPI003D6F42D4